MIIAVFGNGFKEYTKPILILYCIEVFMLIYNNHK